jgi:hypothetical protein
MSEPMAEGYVVKLVYSTKTIESRWVMAGSGRGLGSRENATVFPDRESAMTEAKIWKTLSTQAFTVVIEPV